MQKGEAAMNGKYLLLALSLGACSPYEYSKEVAGFSTGIDQLAAAIEGGYANIPADLANATRQRLVDGRLVVNVAPSCASDFVGHLYKSRLLLARRGITFPAV
jgi:hypothetical protein